MFTDWTDEAILDELGRRIRRTRLNSNTTQADLAAQAGISVDTLRNIEAGEGMTLTSLIRVLRALDVLDHLDAVLPDPGLSPMQLLALRGEERQRASGSRDDGVG
jgi:transcriptional regulator with XRE-family HTH domain